MKIARKVIDSLGPLTISSRAKLDALLTDPTTANWTQAKWVVINREGLSLQEACGTTDIECPSEFVLLRAMQKARKKP